MLRFLSTLRTGLLAGVRWVLQALRTVPALWGRLQPRSWRTWLLLVLALPALLAVYTLLLTFRNGFRSKKIELNI